MLTLEEELRQLLGPDLACEVMLLLLPRLAPIEFPERDINGRAGVMVSIGPDDPTPTHMAIVGLGSENWRIGMPTRWRDGRRIDG